MINSNFARERLSGMFKDYENKNYKKIAIINILESIQEYSKNSYMMTFEQESELKNLFKKYEDEYNELIKKNQPQTDKEPEKVEKSDSL